MSSRTAQRSSPNADGTYSYYPDAGSLSKELLDSATYSVGERGKVTYSRVTANWGAASGSDGAGHGFYIKMLKRQDQIVKLEIRYPARLMRQYDPIAAKVAQRDNIEVAIINGSRLEEVTKYLEGNVFVARHQVNGYQKGSSICSTYYPFNTLNE